MQILFQDDAFAWFVFEQKKTRNFSEWHLERQFQKGSWTYPCQYKNFLWLITT